MSPLKIFLSLLLIFAESGEAENPSKPHILFVLVDDLGWSDVGFHGSKIRTPNVDSLAKDGVVLENYYVQAYCTPTRGALLTGRYPIHTGLQHRAILTTTPFGLPLSFGTLPEKLKDVGYNTHLVGKWHLGHYTSASTPTHRGFDSFFGFYHRERDHFTHKFKGFLDSWENEEIAREHRGNYSTHLYTKEANELDCLTLPDRLFHKWIEDPFLNFGMANSALQRAQKIVQEHDSSKPLFLYMAYENVHYPIQAPHEYVDKYNFIHDSERRTYAAMMEIVDESIGNITRAFKQKGIWNNTIMVFSSDNGGDPIFRGLNYPLRGYKKTLWEGGVKAIGFVHSPLLQRRGVRHTGLLHVTDWYPTLIKMAGGIIDHSPIPVDGFDVWDSISRGTPSPRTEILLNIDFPRQGRGLVLAWDTWFQGAALRRGDMKLLLKVPNCTWYVPPEDGGVFPLEDEIWDQKTNVLGKALYNITADPSERHDLSSEFPDIVCQLEARVGEYMKSAVEPAIRPDDIMAVIMAIKHKSWFPWKDTCNPA